MAVHSFAQLFLNCSIARQIQVQAKHLACAHLFLALFYIVLFGVFTTTFCP